MAYRSWTILRGIVADLFLNNNLCGAVLFSWLPSSQQPSWSIYKSNVDGIFPFSSHKLTLSLKGAIANDLGIHGYGNFPLILVPFSAVGAPERL